MKTQDSFVPLSFSAALAFATCLGICSLLANQAAAQKNTSAKQGEWSRFRGPNGTGISSATSIPTSWTEKDYNWVSKLPGKGSSSPVVWNDHIFLTTSDRDKGVRSVFSIRTKDGSVHWRRDFPYQPYRVHRDNDFASATPVADPNGVVVVWSSPKQLLMLAFDLEGKEQWRKDLGPYKGLHGSASSPIIVNDLVILANDQMNPVRMARYLPKGASMIPDKSFLIAIERKTGKTRWQLERRTELAGYATPCVRQIKNGKPELVITGTAHGVTGIDLATGKVNWEIADVFASRTVASPQLYGELVFGSHGAGLAGQRFVAVQPVRTGSEIKPVVKYEITKSVPLVPSFLIKDDLMFLWTDSGIATCIDPATGKQHWRQRIGGAYYSSPVWINGKIYCASKQGDVVVIAASKTYKLLAKVPLGEKCFAVPAVAGGVMYLRTQTQLFSLGGKTIK